MRRIGCSRDLLACTADNPFSPAGGCLLYSEFTAFLPLAGGQSVFRLIYQGLRGGQGDTFEDKDGHHSSFVASYRHIGLYRHPESGGEDSPGNRCCRRHPSYCFHKSQETERIGNWERLYAVSVQLSAGDLLLIILSYNIGEEVLSGLRRY